MAEQERASTSCGCNNLNMTEKKHRYQHRLSMVRSIIRLQEVIPEKGNWHI